MIAQTDRPSSAFFRRVPAVIGRCIPGLGALVLLAGALSGAMAGAANLFPAVSGYNLDGQKYDVPGDFRGTLNLVIVTFEREQQKDADGWAAAARDLEKSSPDFRYYEVTVMERRNVVLRWWWDSFMRKSIPEQETRDRTIIVYVNKRNFRRQTSIPDETDIHALLITHRGEILWRARGPIDEAKRLALLQELNALRH